MNRREWTGDGVAVCSVPRTIWRARKEDCISQELNYSPPLMEASSLTLNLKQRRI